MKKTIANIIFLVPLWLSAQYHSLMVQPGLYGSATPVESCASIASSSDDAEEGLSDNSVSLTSSDLEMDADGGTGQKVGLRFTGMNIPAGATITAATVQFCADQNDETDPCDVDITAQVGSNPATFTTTANDVTSRGETTATVIWTLTGVDWVNVGDCLPAQETPDISAVIQEVVDDPSYQSTWAIVVFLESRGNNGERTAESFDGDGTVAELCITYTE